MNGRKLDPLQKLTLFWCVWGEEKRIREVLAHAVITKRVNDPVNPHFRYIVYIPIKTHGGHVNEEFNAKNLNKLLPKYTDKHGIEIKYIHYSFDKEYWIQHYLDFFRMEEMSKFETPSLYMDGDAYCINPINTAHPSFYHEDKIIFYHGSKQLPTYSSLPDLIDYYKCSRSEFFLPSDERFNTDFEYEVINFGVFFTRNGKVVKDLYKVFKTEIDKINVHHGFKQPDYTYNEFLLTKIYIDKKVEAMKLDDTKMVRIHPCFLFPNGYLEIQGSKDDVRMIRDLSGYATIVHNLHYWYHEYPIRFLYQDNHTIVLDPVYGGKRTDLKWV